MGQARHWKKDRKLVLCTRAIRVRLGSAVRTIKLPQVNNKRQHSRRTLRSHYHRKSPCTPLPSETVRLLLSRVYLLWNLKLTPLFYYWHSPNHPCLQKRSRGLFNQRFSDMATPVLGTEKILHGGVDPARMNKRPRILSPDEKQKLEEFTEFIHYSSRYIVFPCFSSPPFANKCRADTTTMNTNIGMSSCQRICSRLSPKTTLMDLGGH